MLNFLVNLSSDFLFLSDFHHYSLFPHIFLTKWYLPILSGGGIKYTISAFLCSQDPGFPRHTCTLNLCSTSCPWHVHFTLKTRRISTSPKRDIHGFRLSLYCLLGKHSRFQDEPRRLHGPGEPSRLHAGLRLLSSWGEPPLPEGEHPLLQKASRAPG